MKLAAAASCVFLSFAVPAFSADLQIDLTNLGTATLSGGGANGTILAASSVATTVGTGVIDSFLRVQNNGSETGYNTDGSPLPDNDKGGGFTHSLQFSSLDTATKPGYVTFLLDVNQQSSSPLISLDDIKFYYSTSNTISNSGTPGAGATEFYDIQSATGCSAQTGNASCTTPASTATEILLNYNNNSGSGNGFDMFLYVPVSVFASIPSSDYFYLYSAFGGLGGNYATNDGIEEWARITGTSAVPEPLFVWLPLAGFAGLICYVRRRSSVPASQV